MVLEIQVNEESHMGKDETSKNQDSENDKNLINIKNDTVPDTNTANTSIAMKATELSQKENHQNIVKDTPLSHDQVEMKSDQGECSSGRDNFATSNNETDFLTCDPEIDEIVPRKLKSKRKKLSIFNSDSEEEGTNLSPRNEISEPNSVEHGHRLELDKEPDNEEVSTFKMLSTKKQKRIAFIDSDSEDENIATEKSVNEFEHKEEDEVHQSTIFVVNKEGNLISEEEVQSKNQKKILSNLCDSESSDENNDENEEKDEGISDDELSALQANVIVPAKKRKGIAKETNDKHKIEKMTAKKALEQRKEILAESQRRVRESRVSLPYHKPKPKSLKEFLQNRPKLALALNNVPHGRSPCAAIKMSKEELEVVSRKLKEREKEVEQFYKSESDSDNEEDQENDLLPSDPPQETQSEDPPAPELLETKIIEPEENMVTNQNGISSGQNDFCENMDTSEIVAEIEMNTAIDIAENLEVESLKTDENLPEATEDVDIDNSDTLEKDNKSDSVNIEDKFSNLNEGCQLLNQNETMPDEKKEEMSSEIIQTSEQQDKTEENYIGDSFNEKGHTDDIVNMDFEECTNEEMDEQLDVTKTDETNKNKDIEKSEENKKNDSSECENAKKLIILSDVIVKTAEPSNLKNIYSLDDELLELASESKKDNTGEFDDYDFNLDDVEDDFQCDVEDKTASSEEQCVDENDLKKRRKLEMIQKLTELKPRLSGGPNEVIDLEKGIAMPDEVSKLRDRFFQHNLKILKNKNKKSVSILSVCDGKIRKETLALSVEDIDEECTAPIEKPGVRIQKLRQELQHQMAQRRSELWKEKLIKSGKNEKEHEEEDGDGKSDGDIDNYLDDDEEEEMTESEEEDQGLEENDYDMSEKKKKKSAFVEEEAEESDNERNEDDVAPINEDDIENEDDDIEEMNEEINQEYEEDPEDVEDGAQDIEESVNEISRKKVLKRIIKPSDDDSDNEEELSQKNQMFHLMLNKKEEKSNSDDNFLLPHQPINYKTIEPVVTPTKSDIDFLTPVTYMTGLRNLNDSGSRIATNISPANKQSFTSHKKLFTEETALSSQALEDDFPASPEILDKSKEKEDIQLESLNYSSNLISSDQHGISTQDVLEICSGEFPSSSKSTSSPEISTQQLKEIFKDTNSDSHKSISDFDTQDLADICSGQFTGVSQQDAELNEKETALDEKDEYLISQLIDEEELERFKKKFESPLASHTQKTLNFEQVEEVQGTGGVIDSDDEENELTLKKKKRKKLAFSDDEDSSGDELVPEEAIDLQDDEDVVSNVEYDSEENEIDPEEHRVDPEERKRERLKAAEFFENEAELSESEWGSEDEDEKNLDDMEFEKGDEEKFDEDELRSDLEKIQMRQMLDEDNREVKLLQELLLEDGELHGSGRQRQFKWKNIDDADGQMEERKDDDGDVYLDEDESEEQWRKMRHEREMFMLKRQSKEVDEDCVIVESQKLSFTHKSLKIKSQSSVLCQTSSADSVASPKIKQPFNLLNKRGSFLSRSQQILEKFAEASKISMGTKNNSRIVFQAVDEEQKKRKASSSVELDTTPLALKKMRLTGLSPALQKTKPKSGKSLFGKSTD